MHSYLHNIKTFNSATRHLTRVERMLYRDLIELYYDTEKPLPADNFDRLARRVMAETEQEITALRYVLSEFFELTGDVYTHNYCDEQIEKYKRTITIKSNAGIASARARIERSEARKEARLQHAISTSVQHVLNTSTTDVTQTMNHEPRTISKEKIPKRKKLQPAKIIPPPGINLDYWNQWIAFRKLKRKPVSPVAASKQFTLLLKYTPDQQRELIEKSIANDYQGLFDLQTGGIKSAEYQAVIAKRERDRENLRAATDDYERAIDF